MLESIDILHRPPIRQRERNPKENRPRRSNLYPNCPAHALSRLLKVQQELLHVEPGVVGIGDDAGNLLAGLVLGPSLLNQVDLVLVLGVLLVSNLGLLQ